MTATATTAVAPLTIQDAETLVDTARRAAEAAGVSAAVTVLDAGATCWLSAATTGPCSSRARPAPARRAPRSS
ncbi:uncharacterized protein GlcG (DUF336 family) [Streptomyces sp. V1I1]|nr:uncharacterized protein GlcG (DUF336 family) [Streptomyces sp. V1I1]